MKRFRLRARIPLLAILAVGVLVLLAPTAFPIPGILRSTVTLAWEYPELSTNNTFNLYYSTNLTVSLTNWAMLTNVAGTNLSVTIAVQPVDTFFYVTCSNIIGESPPSNVATQPAPPISGVLSIR